MKKKKLIIDADFLIFQVAEGSYTQDNLFSNESLGSYKKRFRLLVKDIRNEISVELLGRYKIKKKIKLSFSDPDTNFRYDIYPDYKSNRKDGTRSDLFYRLREWVLDEYGYECNTEADDIVAYYVNQKGYVGASFDKDLLKGVGGIWFDTYHSRRGIKETTQREADDFNLLQTLMGDPTDSIKGIPRVGEKTAIKLLDEFGWHWRGVVKAYESKGLTEKEAILNKRLVSMNQWTPKKGVELWEPQKNKKQD